MNERKQTKTLKININNTELKGISIIDCSNLGESDFQDLGSDFKLTVDQISRAMSQEEIDHLSTK